MTKPIGIYGGAFDPIHYGHLRLAWDMLERLQLDSVRLIPTYIPPHRSPTQASVHHRLAMLQCATQSINKLVVDDREARQEAPSYTVNTLISLRNELGDKTPLILIMGMDAFNGLTSWFQWERLLDLAHIAVCQRPGILAPTDPALMAVLKTQGVKEAERLQTLPHGHVLLTQAYCPLDIDATRVRECLQQGRLPKYLVPDSVLDYILEHHLYRGAHANTTAL